MSKPPKELEAHWYGLLKAGGFVDIEDSSREDRPLKSWQSWQFPEESRALRRARNEEYQRLIDSFLHRKDFEEICNIVIKHGNSELTIVEVQHVWELHCEGLPERQIATKLKRSKTGIHKLLNRLRDWMKLA